MTSLLSGFSSSAHFGPSGISVSLRSVSSDLMWRSCNCLSRLPPLFESHRVGYLPPGNSCKCRKARCRLLVESFTEKKTQKKKLFLILCNFRHNHCFVRPIILVLQKSCLVSFVVSSPSSCSSVFHWYFLPSHFSVQLNVYVAFKFTTSDSVF